MNSQFKSGKGYVFTIVLSVFALSMLSCANTHKSNNVESHDANITDSIHKQGDIDAIDAGKDVIGDQWSHDTDVNPDVRPVDTMEAHGDRDLTDADGQQDSYKDAKEDISEDADNGEEADEEVGHVNPDIPVNPDVMMDISQDRGRDVQAEIAQDTGIETEIEEETGEGDVTEDTEITDSSETLEDAGTDTTREVIENEDGHNDANENELSEGINEEEQQPDTSIEDVSEEDAYQDTGMDAGCAAGGLDCDCKEDGTCDEGLVCIEGSCKEKPDCPIGSNGCACAFGGACGITIWGEKLKCKNGFCMPDSCAAGDTGCACMDGYMCNSGDDRCENGYCMPKECPVGEKNCACAGGLCSEGLTCVDEKICMDATGWIGGPCFSDGTCNRGGKCVDGLCEQCTLGTKACACKADGDCFDGLVCENGLCVDQGSIGPQPPKEKVCYTPCKSDLVKDDGTVVTCEHDGLMKGCVGGLKCVQGSCVKDGEAIPTCTTDVDCPDFQTCIKGHCYSDCENDTQCSEDQKCYRHVCRQRCTLNGNNACPRSYACISGDGNSGVCIPVKKPGNTSQKGVKGSFSVSVDLIDFSNVKTTAEVTITNNSQISREFIIHKRSHIRYLDNGEKESIDDPQEDGQECDPTKNCPLYWLKMGNNGANKKVQEFKMVIPGEGGTGVVTIADAAGAGVARWDGTIEVTNKFMGTKTVSMEYIERPEGRWQGTIHYYANFNDDGIDRWTATPDSRKDYSLLRQVGNALIQRWGAFKRGNLSWTEFQAVLTSTQTGSWRWASVKQACPVNPVGACYPSELNSVGVSIYSTDLKTKPIPTGHSSLPFAMNLYFPDIQHHPRVMKGKIDSDYSLQYPGNPEITIRLDADPSQCEVNTPAGLCFVFLYSIDAHINIGGRYITNSSDMDCSKRPDAGFKLVKTPWLVPGFTQDTEMDPSTRIRYRYECRDTRVPWGDSVDKDPVKKLVDKNLVLSLGNPIPDARTRKRHIELIDGALVNQRTMFIIFRETYDSFLPGDDQPFSAYGYIVLHRSPTDLDLKDDDNDGVPNAYDGSNVDDTRTEPQGILNEKCDPQLVTQVLGYNQRLKADNAAKMAVGLIDGRVPEGSPKFIDDQKEAVHYLCEDTGLFDGGPGDNLAPHTSLSSGNNDLCGFDKEEDNPHSHNGICEDGGPGADKMACPLGTDQADCGTRYENDRKQRVQCPVGSNVIFFTVDPSQMSQGDIASLECQNKHSCKETLNNWLASGGGPIVQYKPVWKCQDPNKLFCDENRYDLREGKAFYAATDKKAIFPSIYADISLAFRYKTKFRNREGKNIGFTPEICEPNSQQLTYCYSPQSIEEIRRRVNCLLDIWNNYYDNVKSDPVIGNKAKQKLDDYLCTNFSYAEACHSGMPFTTVPHDGFERLYSELLIMMGDDAYTKAFAARFDLAGINAVSFQGSLFEPNGIDLTGGAGYEMYLLYKAVEYYQEALDRFYRMSPTIWKAVGYGLDKRNFITPATITRYFEKLVRASTQKSRAYSEIAKHYESFNRPDLARLVIERVYNSTYLEEILLSQLMQRIIRRLKPEDRPQVWDVLDKAQIRYRMALLDMRNVYQSITDDVTYFGLPPDYIPFPVVSGLEQNAFEVLLDRAKDSMNTAKVAEDKAIQRSREFETDKAKFQAQLVSLRNTYENQLAQLCGTFKAENGKIYPAIPKYADLSEDTRKLQDPCGLVGNGDISQAMGKFEELKLDLESVRQSIKNVLAEVNIEKERVKKQCNLINEEADFVFKQGEKIKKLSGEVTKLQYGVKDLDRMLSVSGSVAKLEQGMISSFELGGYVLAGYLIEAAMTVTGSMVFEHKIMEKKSEISQLKLDTARWQMKKKCDAAEIDSNARTAKLLLKIKNLQLQALKVEYEVQLALSDIQQKLNTAKRLEDQLEEALQMRINIEAARNDPNTRIYKDNTIVNADIQFNRAMRSAYEATKVFEYYTGQSYAPMEKLFLIRTVQYGDYNLENYILDLQDAYYRFQDTYGEPMHRVEILSLRDDILRIPRLDENGKAISHDQRIELLRQRLRDPSLLDENGYLRIPFATSFKDLSPLTRVHKVDYIEVGIIGSDVGDNLGRIYLKQSGTSVIHTLSDEQIYYRFPKRVAVIDTFFNGKQVFVPQVYENMQLQDRPYINTNWELVFNQRDERVNKDIDLQSVDDIRIYVHYTDFTEY